MREDHGGRNLLGIGRGLGAGRGGEGDAIGFDEARDGEGAGDGERDGREHGDDHDELVTLHGSVEQRLVGEPLGHEAVEGRDGRDGERADQEADGRGRHAAEKTAHLLHVARTGGVEQRAGTQEELALEHRVVERVVEGGHEREHGDTGLTERHGGHGGADAEQDDADVLDGVIGQQALDVMLLQGESHAEDRRDRTEDHDHEAPPDLDARCGEQVETDLQDTEDTDLDHATGHEGGHVGRRLGVRLGQPRVQRDDTGLGTEAEEREHEAHGSDLGAELGRAEIGERERAAGVVGHGEEARHDEHEAHVRDHEVEPAAMDRLLVLLDHDEEVRGQRHELEGDQEPEHVVGRDDEHHRGDEGVEEESGAALLARVLVEVVEAVDGSGEGEHRDERHEQAGQLVEQQLEMREREEHDRVDRRDVAEHGLNTGHEGEHRGDGADDAAGRLGGVVALDEQKRRERAHAGHGKRSQKQRHAIHCSHPLLLSRKVPRPRHGRRRPDRSRSHACAWPRRPRGRAHRP